MNQRETLQTEYEQARDKWIEVNQLRTDWKSEDPVYNELLRDYKEKKHAYYRHLRETEQNPKRIHKSNALPPLNHSIRG